MTLSMADHLTALTTFCAASAIESPVMSVRPEFGERLFAGGDIVAFEADDEREFQIPFPSPLRRCRWR